MSATSTQPISAHIRRADAVDLDALVELEQRIFDSDRISRAQFRRHLDSDSAQVLVCSERGRLLGDAVVFLRRGSKIARLYSLLIAPVGRGRGLGLALLQEAEQYALRRRRSRMRLEVKVGNTVAIRLYESMGYKRFARRENYYEDGADAWRYEKGLKAAG
ncbi:MAG TPA: GNAT family N-acetyltransferase [Rudaea sp.]|nr:GNAT family N-acetyltransferase [Rudaea sp.]